MIFWLASNSDIIWHITGLILYEIILVPLLYIIQYIFLVFIVIITTNVGPEIFKINLTNNQIQNDFNNSPIFIIYVSCLGISILIFTFGILFNIIKDFFGKQEHFLFQENIKWFVITLVIYPLLPIIFSCLLLLTSICFNLLGLNNKLSLLNQQDLGKYSQNYNLYKTEILDYWNNNTLNIMLQKLLTLKLNTNNFYYENLLNNINNYNNFLINNQDIFEQIGAILNQLNPNENNLQWESQISQYIYQLNDFNNIVVNIQTDINHLDYSQLSTIKSFIDKNLNYFNGTLINSLLFSLPYSLSNIIAQLGNVYHFNVIKKIEELCGNNSGVITATPDFYELNWNVLIAIIFSLGMLIILFLYSILEIRRIVELIILFLIAPFSFLMISNDKNYYFLKWFKLTLIKFFSLLLIAIIFETTITIYPYLNLAIDANINDNTFNKIIINCIVAIGVLLASFFSINTILNVFDARENFMEIIGDLYSLKLATKSIPFFGKMITKWKNNNPKNTEYYTSNANQEYELTKEDILFQRVPEPSKGFERFMSKDSTKQFIKNMNAKTQKFVFGNYANKSINFTNKMIEKFLNKKYKKYHMVDQKWKKKREEGEF